MAFKVIGLVARLTNEKPQSKDKAVDVDDIIQDVKEKMIDNGEIANIIQKVLKMKKNKDKDKNNKNMLQNKFE